MKTDEIGKYISEGECAGNFNRTAKVWSETGVRHAILKAIDSRDKRIAELEKFVSVVRTNVNSGTSLAWRMQRLRIALDKLEDKP